MFPFFRANIALSITNLLFGSRRPPQPYRLPPPPPALLPFVTQVPPGAISVEVDVPITDVDSLYEAAGLTEEEEWGVRADLARGRAKLEAL